MHSNDRLVAFSLVALGLALCAGNLWFTAARTTIPLSLNLEVVAKEIRHEKHPGFDDVHLMHANNGSVMVVDGIIYNEIAPGERITKRQWSRQLNIGSQRLDLNWSADVQGMMWAMPTTVMVLVVLGAAIMRRNGEASQ